MSTQIKTIKKAKTNPHQPQPVVHKSASIAKIFLYISLAVAVAVIVWWVLFIFYEPNHSAANSGDYNNLDLSLARQTTYQNNPIVKIKSFDAQKGIKRELVSFDVPKDGLSEYALMTLPTTKPPGGKYPVIILCHGYTNPAFYSTLDAYLGDMEFYSQHGYVVIKPDFRGNGFSVTSGTPDGAYYSMGYNTDVMSLIAAVNKTSYLDSKNISLWGHSMGGYIALRAAVLSPQIKNVVLLAAPVANSQDLYQDYRAVSDTNNDVAMEIRDQELTIHGTPISNSAFWNKTSPLSYLKDLHANVQIYVGSADRIVPPVFSADLNKALNKTSIKHEYFYIKGGSHGLGMQRQFIWAHSLKILRQNS